MKSAKDYIIFPLDLPSRKEAQRYIRLLSGAVGMFKVGLELFIQCGPEIIHDITDLGDAKVFLDLKLHDIPATVRRAIERIATLQVALTTIHIGESSEMIYAAVRASNGRVGVLGVTVLTSVSESDLKAAGFKEDFASNMEKLVLKRAERAKDAGCNGVVCSGLEVGMIKQKLGASFLTVTPGIRPEWEGKTKDDQHRIVTPPQAVKNGSDYLVIGRPIRDANDPKAACGRIAAEIETVIL